jgi:hypothetical protein
MLYQEKSGNPADMDVVFAGGAGHHPDDGAGQAYRRVEGLEWFSEEARRLYGEVSKGSFF